MQLRYVMWIALAFIVAGFLGTTSLALAQEAPTTVEATKPTYVPPQPASSGSPMGPSGDSFHKPFVPIPSGAPPVGSTIEGFNFTTNRTLTGFYFIPPDPICAVGPFHVINIGNVTIQWHRKSDGMNEVTQSLQSFFAPIGPPLGTFTFDPKVIFDQYEGRFVVVALEQVDTGNPATDDSRVLIAVSKTSNPNNGWWYHAINGKFAIGGANYWADYPGFALDDKAVYITTNLFKFSAGVGPSYGGSRLWIVHKGVAGGFYGGGAATVTVHDPYAATSGSGSIATTTQPTHMFGTPPAGMGTWLISHSGLSNGVQEFLQLIGVSNPLGAPVFTHQFLNVGDIDNVSGGLPDAPQLGGPALIEVNDRRCLHAVWRNNKLVTCATILPNAGPDFGQTTAHWWHLDTTNPALHLLVDQGDVGAEDLGFGTYTFFPSVVMDNCDNIGIGFSASN